MTTLAPQTITRDGLNPTLSAAAGGGDDFVNTGQEFVYVKNDDASVTTVTFVTTHTVDEQAVADRAVSVPAGEIRLVGPFDTKVYNGAQGKLSMTYSKVTSLTIGVIRHGR